MSVIRAICLGLTLHVVGLAAAPFSPCLCAQGRHAAPATAACCRDGKLCPMHQHGGHVMASQQAPRGTQCRLQCGERQSPGMLVVGLAGVLAPQRLPAPVPTPVTFSIVSTPLPRSLHPLPSAPPPKAFLRSL